MMMRSRASVLAGLKFATDDAPSTVVRVSFSLFIIAFAKSQA